jgi:hypothetical protein
MLTVLVVRIWRRVAGQVVSGVSNERRFPGP